MTVDGYASPEQWRDWFAPIATGPIRMVRAALADTPDRVAALDADLADLARRYDRGTTEPSWTGSTSWSPHAEEHAR